jgi:glycosyltransferase involved in cell wall biosynthesis
VTPCYRLESYVGATIRSVRAQEMRDWELVVVDDASPDRSLEAARAAADLDPRVRVVARDVNGGVSAARNHGAALGGSSEYLLFLDGDDEIEPGMLGRLSAELDAHPDAVAVHSDALLIDEHGSPMSGGLPPRLGPRGLLVRELAHDVPITEASAILALAGIIPSATLIRRRAFNDVGGFDTEFGHHMEDADLFMRLTLEGEVRYVAERLLRHRRHPGQNTSSPNGHLWAQERKFYELWRQRASCDPRLTAAWRFYDRQYSLWLGWNGAKARLRRRDAVGAARFYAGALSRAARSFACNVPRL